MSAGRWAFIRKPYGARWYFGGHGFKGDLVSMTALSRLPNLADQAERLIEWGLTKVAGVPESALRAAVRNGGCADGAAVLALHPDAVSVMDLVPLIERAGKRGFVVVDMADADSFTPIDGANAPDGPAYVVTGIDRGDAMANWSPVEALPAITGAGRTPLTLAEGVYWLLQQPGALERGRCFMTIASRLKKPNGTVDARTPALWLSNGTGRDGARRRGAPKAGWCWAGNRHTWLGFASAAARLPLAMSAAPNEV